MNVATRLPATTALRLVEIAVVEVATKAPAVRIDVDAIRAAVLSAVPTMMVIAPVPAKAVETLTNPAFTINLAGVAPKVIVTVSVDPAPKAISE